MDSLPLRFKKDQELFAFFGPFCLWIDLIWINKCIVSGFMRINLSATYVERIDFYLTLACSSAFQA